MAVDLIVYGVVAAGLVVWLRSVLGTKHGEERARPNPFEQTSTTHTDDAVDVSVKVAMPDKADTIDELFKNPIGTLSINENAVAGLKSIAEADKMFDLSDFVEKSQDVVAIVIESYAEGDLATLQQLLSETVYTSFVDAVTSRDKSEKIVTDVHAVKKFEITDAGIFGSKAFIKIAFTLDETTITQDENGEITSGDPNETNEMSDTWIFERNVKSNDPRWFVSQTAAKS